MNNCGLELMSENEKLALLFGIMLGDGCLSHYFTKQGRECFAICISGHADDDLEFHENMLVPLLNYFRKKKVRVKKKSSCNGIEINFTSRSLFDKIKALGFPVGKKGPNLRIPKIFLQKNLLKYVVQGFFATDGSLVLTKNPNKFYPRLECQAICKDLLVQIKEYLNSFGMKGKYYISKSKPDSRWKIVHQKHKFQFNGKKNLIHFNDLIGFANPKQQRRFENYIRYSEEYDKAIRGISSKKQPRIRDKINSNFEKMIWL